MSGVLTATELATLVEGSLTGDGETLIRGVAPLDRAGPSDLSFLAGGKYVAYFRRTMAGVVLCTGDYEGGPGPATRIIVKDPHRAMLSAVRLLYPRVSHVPGVDGTSRLGRGAMLGEAVSIGAHVVIGDGARIGDRVVIMAGCVIGAGAELGDDSILYPQVVLYAGARLGRRVIVHAGARIGVDGFGYVPAAGGEHEKIPHVGGCLVGDDVEIGANTTIDRGSVDDTVIGNGTKIDNLVHIGHNCRIGQRCLIMAQVGLAGSVRIEDDVILAGQSGVAGHSTVHAGARVGGQGGVIGDVAAGMTVSGYPARSHRDVIRSQAALYRLAKIVDELELLAGRVRSDGEGS